MSVASPTRRLETELSRLSIDSPRNFETPRREARVDTEDINVLKVLIEQNEVLKKKQELLCNLVGKIQKSKPQMEYKVEGISMPNYYGKMGESVDLYFFQSKVFFKAKNINYKDIGQQGRVLAMLAANLRGTAASWYRDFIGNGNIIENYEELQEAITKEFVPNDLQERLRDKLYTLKQRDYRDLSEYVARYPDIIVQVVEMSDLDKSYNVYAWFGFKS